jgi:hypothetical protein
MLVSISSGIVGEWHGSGTIASARLYANRQFEDSTGVIVEAGSKGRPDFYQEFTASCTSGIITIASGTAYSTIDSDDPTATYSLVIYDSNNRAVSTPQTNLKIPAVTPTTWTSLAITSRSRSPRYVSRYMDDDRLLTLLGQYTDSTLKADADVIGITTVSVTPEDLSNPIAVGDNDARVNKVNAEQYDTFSDAVDAVNAIAGTNILQITTEVTTGAKTVPAGVILEFDNGGVLRCTGAVVIQGEIRAPAQQIFFITTGSLDISAAKADAFYFEWYGITSGGDNTTAMQRLITARIGAIYGSTRIRLLPDVIYSFASPLSFNDSYGIGIVGGQGGYRTTGEMRYTGSGATSAITFKSSQGFHAEGVKFSYSSGTFTGKLLEAGHSGGADTAGFVFSRCFFAGVSSAYTASALITLDLSIIGKFDTCQFENALVGIKGSVTSYSNAVTVDACTFQNVGTAIVNPVQSWTVSNCTFEATTQAMSGGILTGELRAVSSNTPVWNLKFTNNWLGDQVATATTYTVVQLYGAYGAVIDSNSFLLSPAAGSGGLVTLINMDACDGVAIIGNNCTGDRFISYSGTQSDRVFIAGNKEACTTNTPVSIGGIFGSHEAHLGSEDTTFNAPIRVKVANVFGNTLGSGSSDLLIACASTTIGTGTGSAIRTAESVSGYSDGDLVIQPRTDAARKVIFKTSTGLVFKVGATVETFVNIIPGTDDGAALGDTTHNFSDLFLATGAVLNYANGNVAITHSSGILTMGTGEMRITTPGTNSASVVTVGGTQTLTGKTFVAPVLGAATGTSVAVTGALTSSGTAGVGYSTGAGGAVTQASSRTTGVTLNKTTGAITLVSAAGSATPASFTVTNSLVAATDVIVVNQKSGTDLYEIFVTAVAAGSFRITSFTTGGTTTEQPIFNFAVIKGVTS